MNRNPSHDFVDRHNLDRAAMRCSASCLQACEKVRAVRALTLPPGSVCLDIFLLPGAATGNQVERLISNYTNKVARPPESSALE